MPRFLIYVLFGSVGAGLFYAVIPIGIAMGINAVIPFGLDSLTGTTAIRTFAFVCVASILPVSTIAVTRSARRALFGRVDARPALLGHAGSGLQAAHTYKQRAVGGLTIGLLSLLAAFGLALFLSTGMVTPRAALVVPYLSLGSVLGVLIAIESNDLRRTVNRG